MQGKIIAEGLLRAEDGKRYSFELSDIENIGSGDNLVNLEVDFEPDEGRAKSIYILSKDKNSQNSQNSDANTQNSEKSSESSNKNTDSTKDLKAQNVGKNSYKTLIYFIAFILLLAAILLARYLYINKSADEHFAQGDYNNAIILYEKSCKNNSDKNKQESCKKLAQAYFLNADYKKAIKLYKEFCDKDDKESCLELVRAYFKDENNPEGIITMGKLCLIHSDLDTCIILANALEKNDNDTNALEVLYSVYNKICEINANESFCSLKEKLYDKLYKKPQSQVSPKDLAELQNRFSKAVDIIEKEYRYNDYVYKFLDALSKFTEARIDVIKSFEMPQGQRLVFEHFEDVVYFLELVAYNQKQNTPLVSQYDTAEFYDARLTIAYKKIRTVLDKEQKQRFKDNEIAWINFKLAQRDFADSLGYDGNEFIRLANKDQMELLEAICRKLGL